MIYAKIYDNHEDVVNKLLKLRPNEDYYVGFDKKNMVSIEFNLYYFKNCKTDTERLLYSVKFFNLSDDYRDWLEHELDDIYNFLDKLEGRKLYIGYKPDIDKEFLEILGESAKNLKSLKL